MSDDTVPIPEYLSLLKTCFIEIKNEAQEGLDISQNEVELYESIPLWIDRAVVEIKANRQTIDKMEEDMRQLIHENKLLLEAKADYQISERKVIEKTQEIQILKDTIRGLYAETEAALQEKKTLSKQIATLKQTNSSLKKKLKKSEEEANSYRQDIKKITDINDEKMDSYLTNEQAKEQQLRHFGSQLDRIKIELMKKDKQLGQTTRRAQELKQNTLASEQLIEKLKNEKKATAAEYQNLKEKITVQKKRMIQEQQMLLKQLQSNESLLQKDQKRIQQLSSKCDQYEKEIMARTDKLKEKNKHMKTLSQQTSKINKKVEDLSRITEELMIENESLRGENDNLIHQNSQYKGFYHQLVRMKSDLSNRKETEVMKLTQCLEKLTNYNNLGAFV